MELELAKRRLSSVFAKDLGTTRKLFWHTAQIISMAHEYLVHVVCETMRVNIQDSGCVEAVEHEALLLMREMRVWKLAEKFCRILESFDADEI